ncbi:T9SS type A sorting domain-containing protein [Aestuariibaculum sediminum]|uniref:T9SS type A sorting domain-containing protein n=1 Tax=Aestuariibaculum sediminum TaxID=2770637 RepID=A0A8J6PYQ2_9FLAO|nr:T9SS type A sorting domain-containing protein [Aestuariibaculum sediminum]MBD0831232.1 T9SS type A sorting domain-containing protein [Aestuariibaculum sediminum]
MNRIIIAFLMCVACSFMVQGQAFKQDFDDTSSDSWGFTSNIPFYEKNNGTDIWGKFSKANGRIPQAFSGRNYIAGRDLDNEHTQKLTGKSSPEHILFFDPIQLAGVAAEIKFHVQYVNLKSSDYIYYEVAYNDGDNWETYDAHEDIFKTSLDGKYSSRGWKEVKFNVPAGYENVRMRLVIYQNGNAYLGFDDFELNMKTLSANHIKIDGFSFGPNPTRDVLNLKANVILDQISIYNVLGKQVLSQLCNNSEVHLDVSNLPNGIYIAKIDSGNTSESIKIIKK